ncbi:glycosyltransferase [Candidatus Saccharibacteria bacterium]|nr:glycosyltransferase [Candidatus Saccharibacteria bacterium]
MRVALVCDWLINFGGAERVLLELHKMYPDAPIYTSKYHKKGIDWFDDAEVKTGYLQYFPNCLRKVIGPLRARWFRKLDLSSYDLVISVTGAEAKGVKTTKTEQNQKNRTQFSTVGGKTTHICFCHVPTQYYWGLYDQYLKDPGFGFLNPLARLGLKLFVKPMRKKDFEAAKKPDYYITISDYAKQEIQRYYKREATVIYPPVDTKTFLPEKSSDVENLKQHKVGKSQTEKSLSENTKVTESQIEYQNYFITTSRFVNWKRLDLAVKACLKTDHTLVLIGEGPEYQKLRRLAKNSPKIIFLPKMDQAGLKKYLENADAFLFPSQEPFGIAPVEALAAGCPVIAYRKGGALDYIKDGENGLFFESQTVASLARAIERFDTVKAKFSSAKISASALPFDTKIFRTKIQEFINEKIAP